MKPDRHQQIKGHIHKPKNTLLTPLTPKSAHHIAASEAKTEYMPVQRQIKGTIRASGQRQKDISSWYGQLGDQINNTANTTATAYQAANDALNKQLQTAASASQANQAQVSAGNADFSKLVGADPGILAQGDQTAAAAANQRSLMQAALSAPIAAGGASQAAYLGNQATNAAHEGIYQRQQEIKRQLSSKQDLQALLKEKGAATVKNLNDLRTQAQTTALSRQAFGLDKTKAAQAAADDAAKNAIAQQNANSSRISANASKRNSLKPSSTSGGLTPHEKQQNQQAYKNAAAAAHALLKTHFPKSPQDWAYLEQEVAKTGGVSPADAAKVVARLRHRVSKSQAQSQANARHHPRI